MALKWWNFRRNNEQLTPPGKNTPENEGAASANEEAAKNVLLVFIVVVLILCMAQNRTQVPNSSPRLARAFLRAIPKRNREHLIGDLEEEFQTVVLPQYGYLLACCWYCEQVTLAIGNYLWPTIKKILGLSALYKLIGR
jgi:hypothetical protein